MEKGKKMRSKLFIFLLLILMAVIGCEKVMQITNDPEFNTAKDTKQAVKKIEDIQEKVTDSSKTIRKEATDIELEDKEEIKKKSETIIKETVKIDTATEELTTVRANLDKVKKEAEILDDSLKNVIKERDKALKDKNEAIDKKNEKLHSLIRYLIVGCIVGVGIFAVVFFMYGSRFGIVGAAACALILTISIFVEAYFAYLALIGGVILVGLVGVLIWNVVVQKRAFKEVVNTVEITQDNLPEERRIKLFGGQGETGIMDGIQSRNTMYLVQKEKKKMSNLWTYAKVNKTIKDIAPPPVVNTKKKRTYTKKKKLAAKKTATT